MRLAAAALAAALALPARAEEAKPVPITCKPAAVAEVKRALVFVDNVHGAEATATLRHALKLDPGCATAHALLSGFVPPAESAKEIAAAQAGMKDLPAPERTQIEITAAQLRGNVDEARELQGRLTQEAPGDWRAWNGLAGFAVANLEWDRAIELYRKALALNPKAAAAYNQLGYAYIGQLRYQEATGAFRKYAEVAPDEPNSHDSLAEALMNTGRFAESEAEFQKALALDPKFAGAWTGVAEARYLRGNWKGGDQALAKELSTDPRPQVRLFVEVTQAWGLLAQGKVPECFKKLAETSEKAQQAGLPLGLFGPAIASRLAEREGDVAEAVRLAADSLARTEAATLPEGTRKGVLRGVLIEVVRAQAAAGHGPEAQAAAKRYEAEAEGVKQVGAVASQIHDARGLAALAAGDTATAIAELKQCLAVDFNCRYDLFHAQEKSGDAAGAAATRAALLKTPLRGIEYVYLWRKLGGAGAPRG